VDSVSSRARVPADPGRPARALGRPAREARVVDTATVRIERPADRQDELRVPRSRVRFLTIPSHRFVAIEGAGPPLPESFEARMPGLYETAYGLRFELQRRGVTTRVGPLEGLWWTGSGGTALGSILSEDRDDWRWTLMICLPDEARDDELDRHLELGRAKLDRTLAPSLRIERFEEREVAQLLHLGPYAEEPPSIERLHAAVHDAGFDLRGRHHELYLGDPRRSAPERLRTLLRHPIAPR
jgi:hypothetical protein